MRIPKEYRLSELEVKLLNTLQLYTQDYSKLLFREHEILMALHRKKQRERGL